MRSRVYLYRNCAIIIIIIINSQKSNTKTMQCAELLNALFRWILSYRKAFKYQNI